MKKSKLFIYQRQFKCLFAKGVDRRGGSRIFLLLTTHGVPSSRTKVPQADGHQSHGRLGRESFRQMRFRVVVVMIAVDITARTFTLIHDLAIRYVERVCGD